MTIRKDVSKIVEMVIPPKGWRTSFKALEREGKIGTKVVIQILVLLLQRESAREEEKALNIEKLDEKVEETPPKMPKTEVTSPKPAKKKKTGKNVKK